MKACKDPQFQLLTTPLNLSLYSRTPSALPHVTEASSLETPPQHRFPDEEWV